MDYTSEQHYGSTLSFSIVRSEFQDVRIDSPTQTVVRTLDKISVNLSQYGSWRCIFEETKQRHRSTIELHLSLSWISNFDPEADGDDTGQAQELISRIKSVKLRSDSTLSELLVGQLDGRCLLKGEFLKSMMTRSFPLDDLVNRLVRSPVLFYHHDRLAVRLQPNRVLRNDRYKFRISFYTQDVSRLRCSQHAIFTSFLDIDPEFTPSEHRRDQPPDITFQFPRTQRGHQQPTTIMAHSSAIQQSEYLAQRVAEVIEEKTRSGLPYTGVTCAITEFSPDIFRVMLRYLYTGRLRMKSRSREAERQAATATSTGASELKPSRNAQSSIRGAHDGCVIEESGRAGMDRVVRSVYFEDLYRISERYEVAGLRALALKAMQCSLNMSIAIAILAKLSRSPSDIRAEASSSSGAIREQEVGGERGLDAVQVDLAIDMVREYVQFFGWVVATEEQVQGFETRVEDCLEMIHYIGDCVINNLTRLWE
ncbi:hypothetical protein BGZ99_009326 [Dissophora globulifera]|uniref:BTB domain-containing protein n=1 Tax=Dissophora globulifera TaxID=979702 RepID=A0A9P6UNI6_9FUNG|nr:hypothetical protein BGZ99_009326 [Dissophora globulifera]